MEKTLLRDMAAFFVSYGALITLAILALTGAAVILGDFLK